MSQLYSIQESTLTDIGDALRSKYGETRLETIQVPCVVSKTHNATGPDSFEGAYDDKLSIYDVVYIPGASKIVVDMSYQTESTAYDWVQVAEGELNSTNFPTGSFKYGGNTRSKVQLEFNNDVITFYFRSDSSNGNYLGYYAICSGYDADGNPIELESSTIIEKEVEVPNTYSSADVAAAIEKLNGAVEPIVLTGNQERACGGSLASIFIEKFGNAISTLDLTDAEEMFRDFTGKYIPFDLNFTKTKNGTHYVSSLFYNCNNLRELPKVNNLYVYNSLLSMFYSCKMLREIPEDYFDSWTYSSSINSYTRFVSLFRDCYSLRSMPLGWLKNMPSNSSTTGSIYYEGFYYCRVLDEIVDLPIPYTTTAWTSNAFSYAFAQCSRLKKLTFKTNEDGSPIVVQWKGQTISLNENLGWYNTRNSTAITQDNIERWATTAQIIGYNSGITADKAVYDETTYQALKDDPDWFCIGSHLHETNYCRYNRISAVETINSLPDASAYLATAGGTNTIKFIGISGKGTDGGAINTMTEEEIAVAAAKGWTVTFE